MKLLINGEERTFSERALTLASLVESLQMKPDRVAVELNRDIVQRDRWPETPLKDGDRLEIVHFVGGGSSCSRGPLEPRFQAIERPSPYSSS
jgi:thiamine biosynthesis protein ThiS